MRDNFVKSADRVITLLELLGGGAQEMSHAELAEVLEIPKSSLSQLLKTLLARRWIRYSPDTKTYGLGEAIGSMARRANAMQDIASAATDILTQLTAATAESSALNIRKGDESEVIATQLSPLRLLSIMRLGNRAPLYATSGGKTLLAFLPEVMIEDYIDRIEFEAFTPNTLRSKKALKLQLKQVKLTGVAYSFEEFTPGIVGIACPLKDPEGRILASVNVAMPAIRYSKSVDARSVAHITHAVGSLQHKIGLLATTGDKDISTEPRSGKRDIA